MGKGFITIGTDSKMDVMEAGLGTIKSKMDAVVTGVSAVDEGPVVAMCTKLDMLVASVANEALEVAETNSVGTGLGAGSSRYSISDIAEGG